MKRILFILSIAMLTVFYSCDDEIDFKYQGKSAIQFKHYTTNYNGSRTYFDKVIFSFGLLPQSIQVDTAKIVVEFLGHKSDVARKYNLEIDADSTTAVAGVHYELLDKVQTFRANAFKDTLRIVVHREKLSKSFINPTSVRLDLVLKPSEDFDLGMIKGQRMSVYFNDYLSEPNWWKDNFFGQLNYFHPEKWKILIEFNTDYAVYTGCKFNINNEGRQHLLSLKLYLEKRTVIDKETGDRVLFDRIEPKESF